MPDPLLRIENVSKTFEVARALWGRRQLRAVDHVDLVLDSGRTLGVVGESGSGKSTLCRLVLGLLRPTTGRVLFEGRDLARLSAGELRRVRRRMQAVFQDTASAFNPRQTVRDALLAPLDVHGIGTPRERLGRVREALYHVGLDESFLERHPHMLSGGQRQRVAIARAIILRPSLVIADEPTSALDVSVQARILNLFRDIQRELGLTYLFVSHNLGVIRYVSDVVAVMYLGRVVEVGPVAQVFAAPRHPYTRALLASIPHPDPARRQRELPVLGELPGAYQVPPGCRFHPRCPVAMPACAQEDPPLYHVGPDHRAACLWHDARFAGAAPGALVGEKVTS
ncbi:MAG: ABC transporter ATP-binding protein [Armatimonadota bacterium]|nr:ABC transporter ATP-binding protein [Armatimonadota bacterium]MDR7486980.1 ABC transporter ATP-binding protein [Armatimonadota bacterium]MDR7532636.1 ABC transporter ATP-binding protein [Armatimonadota bacterium]MDR7536156.1 ABC transporter ATP-binding protein [Armatimonadota bacterium]